MNLSFQDQTRIESLLDRPWEDGSEWFYKIDKGRLNRYIPNAGQYGFHASPARFRALIGGRGSGKTTAGAQEALRRVRLGQPGAGLNPRYALSLATNNTKTTLTHGREASVTAT